MRFGVFVVFSLLSSSLGKQTAKLCPEVDGNSESCVCKSPNGIIDLRDLSSRNGTPRFQHIYDSHHYYYNFNPCQAFSGYGSCINVHICQRASYDTSIAFDIADQGTEEIWIDSVHGPYLYYTGPGSREVTVYLHCDRSLHTGSEKLTTTGDTQMRLSYIFDLYSCHACPGGCKKQKTAAGEIGFLLIFMVVLGFVTYFAVGVVILKFHYGFQGRNAIPNLEFWGELPYYVRDGFTYTFSCCQIQTKEYEETEITSMGYEHTL